MKIFGHILLACVLLAALQSLIAVALVLLGIALLWGAFFRTAATFNLLFTLLLLRLVSEQPKAFIFVAGTVFMLLALIRRGDGQPQRKHRRSAPPPLALPGPQGRRVWPAGGDNAAVDG
jgi:hypothetical protein